jgi:ribosomal protein L14
LNVCHPAVYTSFNHNILQVIDNSGALLAECVNVLKNKVTNGWGSVGDEIVVVVQKARPISAAAQASVNAVKVRRGDVRRAVIVRTRKLVRRPDGSFVRFDDNAAVLLNNKREMLGTRIGGIVSADLRLKGWGKIVSLAPRVSSPQTNLSPSFRLQLSVLRLYDIVNLFSRTVSIYFNSVFIPN